MVDPVILAVAGALYLESPISLRLDDVGCLAEAVYFESRDQPVEAQVAVASVVLRRGRPCEVVQAPKQFSYRRGSLEIKEPKAWRQSVEVAVLVSSGAVEPYCATHFHDTSAKPRWTSLLRYLGKVGNLKFWRDKRC